MGEILSGAEPAVDYGKFLELPDSDNIRIKGIVQKRLLADSGILDLLNAAENAAAPGDYVGKYIFPYLVPDGAGSNIHHYLCFETSFDEFSKHNELYKQMQIIFHICISQADAIHPQSGIARHDLISLLITRNVNWTEAFGAKCRLVRDHAGAAADYVTRTLVFECSLLNGVSKSDTATGESFFCNSDADEDWC